MAYSNIASKKKLIMPTPLNVLSEVHKNIVTNLRRGKQSDLGLPSLYRLAFTVQYNPGATTIVMNESEEQ